MEFPKDALEKLKSNQNTNVNGVPTKISKKDKKPTKPDIEITCKYCNSVNPCFSTDDKFTCNTCGNEITVEF